MPEWGVIQLPLPMSLLVVTRAFEYAAPSPTVWPWTTAAEEEEERTSGQAGEQPQTSTDTDTPHQDSCEEGHGPDAPRLHTMRSPLLMVQTRPAAAAAAATALESDINASQAAALTCGIIQHLLVQLRCTTE